MLPTVALRQALRCTKVCSLIHLSHTVIRIFKRGVDYPCPVYCSRTVRRHSIALSSSPLLKILSCPNLLCNGFSHSPLLNFHVWPPFANHRATPHYRQLPSLRVKVSAEKASTPATVGNAKIRCLQVYWDTANIELSDFKQTFFISTKLNWHRF